MSVDLSHLGIPKSSNWPISQCKTARAYTKIGLMYRCQDKSTTSPYHLQKESSGGFTFFHLFLVRCCIIIIVLYTIIQYIILGLDDIVEFFFSNVVYFFKAFLSQHLTQFYSTLSIGLWIQYGWFDKI